MRTSRSLTVCCSLLPGGVCSQGVWSQGGVCSGGCLLPEFGGCLLWGVSAPGGCLLWGVSDPGGVCSWWGVSTPGCGVCSRRVSALGVSAPGVSAPGGYIPACTEADTPRGQNSWHTLVKILPWPNFVAAGKYIIYIQVIPVVSQIMCVPIAFLYKAYLPPRKTPNTRSVVGATIGLTVLFILFGWSVKLNF